MIEVIF